MIENTDTLLALAEIAAAFAGFAALVSVIRRSSTEPGQAAHDLLRLRLVIGGSVAGVTAALVPVGLDGFGLDATLTWRVAAGLFLLFDNSILVSFVSAYQPVRGTFPPDRLAVGVTLALESIEQVALVAVVSGLFPGNAPALYVTALIANIIQAGFIFVRFVGSAFQREIEIAE
jgi:hypothetical protein